MANAFITPDIVAREALMVLENNLISSSVMSSSVASEFTGAKVGDTVKVRRPTFFATDDYTNDGSGPVTIQSIAEKSTNVVIEKLYDVSFEVTNNEMSLKVDQFRDRLLVPAMAALSQKIDTYAFGKVNQLGGFESTAAADVTPLDTLPLVASIPERMNHQQVPMTGRKWVVSPAQQTALYAIEAYTRADWRGGGASPVLEANLGRFMGLDVVMSQNMPQNTDAAIADTAGTLSAVASVGDTTVSVAALTNGATVNAGTTFGLAYLDGKTRHHKVTTSTTLSGSGTGDLPISPPIYGHDSVAVHATQKYATAADAAVTVLADSSARTYTTSAAFVPEAFQIVFIPQADPMGPGTSSASVSWNGMSLRVLQTYDHLKKKDMISVDCLVGAACVDGRLGITTSG